MKRRAFLAAAGLAATPSCTELVAETPPKPVVTPYLPAHVLIWASLDANWMRHCADTGIVPKPATLRHAAEKLERMIDLWEQAFFRGNPPICAEGHQIVGDNVRLSMPRIGKHENGWPTYRHARVCRKCYLSSRFEDEGMRA